MIVHVEMTKYGRICHLFEPVSLLWELAFNNTTGESVPEGEWLWIGEPEPDEELRNWLIMDDRNGAWFEKTKMGWRYHHGIVNGILRGLHGVDYAKSGVC